MTSPGADAGLLAVDLGLRAGLALWGRDGRLLWYRSTRFGTMTRLKQGLRSVLQEAGPPAVLYAEGDLHHFELWSKEAVRLGARARRVPPERWRGELLLGRERRSGLEAKAHADGLARTIVEWSGAKGVTSLRHDAAEAILLGLYGVLAEGWLDALPAPLAARMGRAGV